MYALDFEYDHQYLSDYGFIICDFNGASGANVVSAGSRITFNTVSKHRGKKFGLIGTQYDECIQTKFDICKDPEIYDDLRITYDEYRDLVRWLNRNEYLKFQILFDPCDIPETEPCYYEASFNVEKVKIGEVLYGLELTMETNAPFGYGEEYVYSHEITVANSSFVLKDVSDEIGCIYPSMTITCKENGDVKIVNAKEECTMLIRNCTAGEVISIDGNAMIISTSYNRHDICDDFNYEFFRISNTFNDRNNQITVSLPCMIEIRYSPIVKESP